MVLRDAATLKSRLVASLALFIGAAAMAQGGHALQGSRAAEIEVLRTTDDIPHVRARSWRGLGIGYGHAQAQDALCTLADTFMTVRGRRSFHLGPQGRPQAMSTLGQPSNLEMDFFFHAFADEQAVQDLRRQQPPEFVELIAGFAEGYNRYVDQVRRAPVAHASRHDCAAQAWLEPIAPEDIYRRLIAASLAGGYGRFIPELVNARPAGGEPLPQTVSSLPLADWLRIRMGDSPFLGSNVLAFGGQATGGQGGVLFGNPHWYWGGPDRFYQAHLTIPGKMDVAGVSFLGIPVIMIGFNRDVAWSHTVSNARRFGLFELALDPADPTRYVVDGLSEPMQTKSVSVVVRQPGGGLDVLSRTFYRTRFGPVIDLGRRDVNFAWGRRSAMAMRDVNEDNHRVFRNFFRWNRARSLAEFMEIQRQEAAMPWVNTAAIGRGDGRVWYADLGAVPDVPDELRTVCASPLAGAMAKLDPRTPVLDGSRSACQWRVDPASAQSGAMAAQRLPSLLREDYVANMNDSYWLANPAQPLVGYAGILGGERIPLSLRGRQGHLIADRLVKAHEPSAKALAQRLMTEGLTSVSYPAEQFKTTLLAGACKEGPVPVVDAQGAAGRVVDVRQACHVLREWADRAEPQARGVLLWEAFWTRVQAIPAGQLYEVAFSERDPLHTPRSPRASDPQVAQALAKAVEDFKAKGWALDEPLHDHLAVQGQAHKRPLYGGCLDGYFAVMCAQSAQGAGTHSMGNTHLQVVYFDVDGVHAYTLLAHGQGETALTGGPGGSAVDRYVRRNWLKFPFKEADILSDPMLRRQRLQP